MAVEELGYICKVQWTIAERMSSQRIKV